MNIKGFLARAGIVGGALALLGIVNYREKIKDSEMLDDVEDCPEEISVEAEDISENDEQENE